MSTESAQTTCMQPQPQTTAADIMYSVLGIQLGTPIPVKRAREQSVRVSRLLWLATVD